DLFVYDRSIEVIRAERKRDLGRLDSEHDPVRLDVREVIQHEAADGHDAQVHETARLLDVREAGMFRGERQRNKGLEAAGVVLELSQTHEMIDAMRRLFNVTI